MDRFVLGKPLSHTFLVLKSGGSVIGEIHGTWERKAGYKQTRLAKAIELSIATASFLGQGATFSALFNKISFGQHPVNVVRSYEGNKQYHNAHSEIILLEGDANLMEHWDSAVNSAERISDLSIPYARYGFSGTVNCQTTLRAVMQESSIPRPRSGAFSLGVPGWNSVKQAKSGSFCSRLAVS